MKTLRLFIAMALGLLVVACSQNAPEQQIQEPQISDPQTQAPQIIDSDIALFWTTFDALEKLETVAEKEAYFEEAYISKGSIGLEKMMQARRYTAQKYIRAIENYPEFWASIRDNMQDTQSVGAELNVGLSELRDAYPNLRPARIFFTVGALRSNGTILGGDVLIGSELAFADSTTVSDELRETLGHLPDFFATNPAEGLTALLLHEYVHTQQTDGGGYNLLSWALYEGVAEFASTEAIGRQSEQPSIQFGLNNDAKIRAHFATEMFARSPAHWLWNSADNDNGMRDLGYYVGYAIASLHWQKAADKEAALIELIELDYKDESAVEDLIERSGYFGAPLSDYKAAFEAQRPEITDHRFDVIDPASGAAQLTLNFSKPVDRCCASADFGPLGKNNYPSLQAISFSDDGLSATYDMIIEADKRYQMQIMDNFRDVRARPLRPRLIEFSTGTL